MKFKESASTKIYQPKLDDLPGFVFYKDIHGVYQQASNSYKAFFRAILPTFEIIGKRAEDLFAPEEARQIEVNDAEVYQLGTEQCFEERCTLSPDNVYFFSVTKTPAKDENNNVCGLICAAVDITRFVANNNYFQIGPNHKSTKAFLQEIMMSMPGILYWKNLDGVYLGCNDFRMSNVETSGSVVGKTDYELWPLEADELRKHDCQVLNSGEAAHFEEQVTLSDGSKLCFMVEKMPLRDEHNRIVGIVGNSLDITDLKNTQAQLEVAKQRAEVANEAKLQFLATVSHELRTPLNCILGMSEILKARLVDEHSNELLGYINSSGQHLLALVDDILDFSKLESGTLTFRDEIFDLHKVVLEVASNVSYQLGNKAIEIKTDYDENLPDYVWGDKRRIKQILLNLSSNAIKFTMVGQITIRVEQLGKPDKSLNTVKFSVCDTGIGIPADKRDVIFERFTQINSGYTRRYGGVGLGLAICKQLVAQMNGEIGVESIENQGSSFWFELKLKFVCPKKNKIDNLQNGMKQFMYKKNILLVEDNELNQKVALMLLEQEGCCIDLAENGEQALTKIRKNMYDCVLMDLSLPDTDGIEVTKKVRASGINEFELPIVAVTAHAYEEHRIECIRAGMNDVISKPISVDKIRELFLRLSVKGNV